MVGRIAFIIHIALLALLLGVVGATRFPALIGQRIGALQLDMLLYAGLCMTGPALAYTAYTVSRIRQGRQIKTLEISFSPTTCAGCGRQLDTPSPTRKPIITARIQSITRERIGGFMSRTYRQTTVYGEFKRHNLAVCPVCERNARFDRIVKIEALICLGAFALVAVYLATQNTKAVGPFIITSAVVLALPVGYLIWWRLEARLKRYAVFNRAFGDWRVREFADAKGRPVWKFVNRGKRRFTTRLADGAALELPRFIAFTLEEYARVKKRGIPIPD